MNISTLIELPNAGLVKVSGVDTKKFLQGQLTCNVDNIASDNGMLAAHCNPQGRIISLFRLIEFQDNLYLSMPRNMVDIAIAALKKYSIFFKVDISDASDKLTTVGIISADLNQSELANEMITIKIPSTTIPRYLSISHSIDIKPKKPQQISEHDWANLNIQDGIPTLHPETTGIFLPHELNLDKMSAISFDKGCYTGQEIIARMHYRGKLKSRMHKAEINAATSPTPGADIFIVEHGNPRAIGKIIDSNQDSNNCYNLLVTLEESHIGHNQIFLQNNNLAYITLID